MVTINSCNTELDVGAAGEVTRPVQPAFFAFLSATDNNRTGAGATYIIGSFVPFIERYDQGNNFTSGGFFTAPVAGRYAFYITVYIENMTTVQEVTSIISSSNVTVWSVDRVVLGQPSGGSNNAAIIDMDAGDICLPQVMAAGEAGNTCNIGGSSPSKVTFSGNLVV